ncbi:MAG: Rpn family recombination-promoting nuclease/putative transposase [Spirochaetaceae bacterium]|nr:Rpn family recombination-promoting nuclease/putative transposase [Spirochaetaceae bacterium]
MRRGRNYDKIRPAYCVAICGFTVLPELPGYIHNIALREEKTGALFTNLENAVIIELPKMPQEDNGSRARPCSVSGAKPERRRAC